MSLTAMDLVALAKQSIQETPPSAAKANLAQYLVLDVREPAEFSAGHLPNAVNIPRGILEFRINNYAAFQNKQAEIVIYCQSGGRAALAAEALQKLGYQKVVSIAGGFAAWQAAGYPVVI